MTIAPTISVIMPVYNCEKYIAMSIESILNQTINDFELLIIDDASTDQTLAIITSYEDTRIKIISKPVNSGYTESLNIGLKIAKGKYIARMDGDDISFTRRFEKQLSFLESNPEVLVCGTLCEIIGRDYIVSLPENHESIKVALLHANCIIHPSVMMRNAPFKDFLISYDKSKEPAEDYDLWVRLINKGKLHNLQEVLIGYRVHANQVSKIHHEKQRYIAQQIRLHLLNSIPFPKIKEEIEILRKILSTDFTIKMINILYYNRKIKKKILVSNTTEFFEKSGLESYLNTIEHSFVRSYFFKRNKYNPTVFFNYLFFKNRLAFEPAEYLYLTFYLQLNFISYPSLTQFVIIIYSRAGSLNLTQIWQAFLLKFCPKHPNGFELWRGC